MALDPSRVEVDVGRFETAVSQGTPEALELAARLYGGDLLAGLVVQAPPFEEWLAAERERLRERAIEALARLCGHQRRVGAVEAAVDTALRLLALDPLQESIHRTLMRLYADLGRRGAALRQYQACVRRSSVTWVSNPTRRRSSSTRTSCAGCGRARSHCPVK